MSSDEITKLKESVRKSLEELRSGPFGEKIRIGEKKLFQEIHKK